MQKAKNGKTKQPSRHVSICEIQDIQASVWWSCKAQRKQEFLTSVGLDKVYEIESIPVNQIYDSNKYGNTVGDIPVEVL